MSRFCRKRREFVCAFIRKSSPLRSINFRPDETKVAEQDRAECFEALATDRLNNQPLPAKGKNVFFGKVTARSWVNALRSSKSRLRLSALVQSFSRDAVSAIAFQSQAANRHFLILRLKPSPVSSPWRYIDAP